MPARNEGPRLGAVLGALRVALPEAPVLVVDGGSTDDTAAVAHRAGATVIAQDQPGYAGALVAGYRHLLAAGHRRVLTLDADGQHPPAAARELVLRSAEGWDWVVASRQGTKSPTALRNRLAHAILAEAVRLRSGWRPGDPTSGYHVVQDALLERVPGWLEGGVADANLRACARHAGFRVLEMPVRMASRQGGASMHAGLRGWRNGLRSLRAVAEAAAIVDQERVR